MTGHLVFSTLHTNDAISAVARLLDLGIPDYLVASTLEGVLAQRLVRRICDACRAAYVPNAELVAQLASRPVGRVTLQHGLGCADGVLEIVADCHELEETDAAAEPRAAAVQL